MIKNRFFYGDDKNQFGDLRLPDGKGPHPVAIVIHGGFWRAHTGLEDICGVAQDLTKRGIATWNIEYRRVGHSDGGWPNTFMDVAWAADHLFSLAEPYSLDLGRVITVGHSAGGCLALWMAGRHRLPQASVLRTGDPLPIHGAVSLAGILGLNAMYAIHYAREQKRKVADNPVFDLLGGNPNQVSDRYNEASPIDFLPIGVKQILIHGLLDIIVPVGISLSYIDRAKHAGDEVKMIELPNVEHFEMVNPQSAAWPTIADEIVNLVK